MRVISRYVATLIFLLSATAMAADDRTAYNERAAASISALFQSLDRNADGLVTREESRGDLNFGPRFSDMDINSDDNGRRRRRKRGCISQERE